MNISFLSKVFAFPLVIFLVDALFFTPFDLYETYWWLDILMHFTGGMAVGFSFCVIVDKLSKKMSGFYKIIIVVALVALIAVFWEFWEFAVDLFFGLNWQNGLSDTLGDLFFGILGGLAIAVVSSQALLKVSIILASYCRR